ncbi:MAG: hypothetical protein HY719_09025, partial [Planctomycetes bacterium]|nr:hypothetical protein [Planctomycetota bacterium]
AYGASAVAAALACGSPVARALLLLPLEPGDTGDDRGACRLIAREAAATDPLSLLPARLFASLLRHGAAGVAAATDLFETATDPIAEDVVNQVFAFLTESEFPRTVVRRVAGALLARFPAASTRLRAAIIRSRVAEHPALRAPERRGFAEAFVDEALRASLPDARQEIEHGVTRLGPSALAVLVERMGETPGGSAGAALRRMTGETALAVGERKTAAVAALLAGAARAIGAALDGGRTEDRGGAFLALGKVSSRPALPVREYRVAFNRLIKTRTSPGRWLHDTVEAQGYLAAHPAAAKRGLRGACFRSFFTAMGCHAPVGGNRDTRPADPRLNRPDTESDLFPRMLRALVRLCPMPDTAPHLRWQAVERLRLKFQSMAQGGERWGPLGVLALANALADLARMQPDSTAAPAGVEWGADQHRGRIVRTLLLRLDLAPVAEMAAALCRDFPGDHALDGHAAALIAMALARLDRGEEVEPEERRRLCRIAAFSARRPVIGDPKSHDGLRRRVLRALAARVPDGATEVRDLRDDLARYTRQPTGETAKT